MSHFSSTSHKSSTCLASRADVAVRIALFGVLGLAAACQGTGGEDAAFETGLQSQAIVNGTLSRNDESVVALVYHGKQFCSGTMVGKRTVVTAAHCLPPNIDIPVQGIEVYFGNNVASPGTLKLRAVDGLANPDWNSSIVGGDIGVLALGEDAPVAIMPMAYLDMSAADLMGNQVRAVGFGITAANGEGNGTRRTGLLTVDRFDNSSLYLSSGPSSTCNGDSGGAVLFVQNGVEVIGAINSRSDCANSIIAERIDIHTMDFIMPFLEAQEGAASCAEDGMCATGCDKPDPDCQCAADGMCTDDCAHPEADRDCSTDCPADGVCDESCSFDYDCALEAAAQCPEGDENCDEEVTGSPTGGCSVEGGSGAGSVGWMGFGLLMLLGAARRRRPQMSSHN